MATKVYFMINLDEKFRHSGYQEILRDLVAIPEVESIERVNGICDLMVKVEAPIRVGFLADKIVAKEWVKSLRVVNVEPAELSETIKPHCPEFLKAQRTLPSKQ